MLPGVSRPLAGPTLLLLSLLWISASLGRPACAADDYDDLPDVSLRDALYEELAQEADHFQRQYGIVKRVYRLARPTIVHIDARKQDVVRGVSTGTAAAVDEAGAGIIVRIDEQSYVLTNRHVIHHAAISNIHIRNADDVELTPSRVWSDLNTDVAVIGIAPQDQTPARLANSDEVEIGDFVIAVGSPFGLSHSVSYGIVSAKGRWDLSLGNDDGTVRFQDFIQTDAAINPGNSGGPLINLRGEVVAMNTAIASNSGGNEGIGFAIPINLAIHVARQLILHGTISTAYLGVVLDNKISQRIAAEPSLVKQLGLARPGGAFVKDITPGSPADEARFQRGDIIIEFNGMRVEDDSHLVNLVSLQPLNDVVAVKVVRGRQTQLMHVKVGNRADYD